MVNGFRTSDLCGVNKGRGSKFHVGSQARKIPEDNRRIYWAKYCEYKMYTIVRKPWITKIMCSSMSQKTLRMTFFTVGRAQNFLIYPRVRVFSLQVLSFRLSLVIENPRLAYVQTFFALKHVSLYTSPKILHDFLFFRHRKFDDLPLFKPGSQYLIYGHFE